MSTSTHSTSDGRPQSGTAAGRGTGRHKAGAFDIRNFIGTLLGLYGLVLTVMGLVGDRELGKTGGINANLWAGIGLLVVTLAFVTWARRNPAGQLR